MQPPKTPIYANDSAPSMCFHRLFDEVIQHRSRILGLTNQKFYLQCATKRRAAGSAKDTPVHYAEG